MGSLHSRCRVTPYPVTMDYVHGTLANGTLMMDYRLFACAVAYNFTMDRPRKFTFSATRDRKDWTSKKDSVWHERRDCYWPTDASDQRFCSQRWNQFGLGLHQCLHPKNHETMPESGRRWCGSNYDALANERFKWPRRTHAKKAYGGSFVDSGFYRGSNQGGDSAVWIERANFGYTSFDNYPNSIVTLFQIITLEGWSDIMYHYEDAFSSWVFRHKSPRKAYFLREREKQES